MEVYRGNIVYAQSEEQLAEYEGYYITVDQGIIQGVYPSLPQQYAGLPVTDFGDDVLIPAFSDLHVHAPQYPQRGLAMDALLPDWLQQYTFPLEAKYADISFARQVYRAFVDDLIRHGTMHAVVFGTIHREAASFLMDYMEEKELSAYVGKVNMDTGSPDILCESTEGSLRETELFLQQHQGSRYAKPILTPRFAPTCSRGLLEGLGKLAQKYHTGMQTHLVESGWEAKEARRLFPDCSCDTQIYERAGLLENGPVVGAHFIFPEEEDIRILKKYNGYAVQCPDATINIMAGIMQTAGLSRQGIMLGLGSDIAGGHCLGIFSQVARAVQLSKIKEFYEPEGNQAISFAQAFYMGTKQSGSLFGKVGSLEPGYSFDALVIGGLADPFMSPGPAGIVERFCYTGGTEHIKARYLHGKLCQPGIDDRR